MVPIGGGDVSSGGGPSLQEEVGLKRNSWMGVRGPASPPDAFAEHVTYLISLNCSCDFHETCQKQDNSKAAQPFFAKVTMGGSSPLGLVTHANEADVMHTNASSKAS